jgi:hypothetical protein
MASTWHCLPILLLKLEKIESSSSESSNPVFHVSVDLSEMLSWQITRSSSWTPKSKFFTVSSPFAIFLSCYSPKLIGEFTSLEEPSEYSIIATVSGSLADRSGFAGSERRVEPEGPMKMLRLPIVNSIS